MSSHTKASRFPLGAQLTLAELESDPHPLLRRLRAHEPVSWVPALDAWLVTDRSLVIEALRDDEVFTVDDPRFSTARVVGPSMLSTDGDEHDRHRRPFVDPYRRSVVRERMVEWVEAKAAALVGQLAPNGAAELRVELAAPLAVATILESLGLVDVEAAEALGWYRTIVDAVQEITAGHLDQPAARASYGHLRAAVVRTIEHSDTSFLVPAARHLSIDEVAANTAVIMFGAIETSEGAIAGMLWHLLEHRDQLDDLSRDRRLVAGAVEESLRLEPAAASLDRYTTEAVELGGVPIGRRDYVVLSLAGANRDPVVFDDPDAFDIRRSNAGQHLTFAVGPHACLGIHLARHEMAAACEAVLEGLPGIELDAARSRPPSGLVFRKPAAVGAAWPTA